MLSKCFLYCWSSPLLIFGGFFFLPASVGVSWLCLLQQQVWDTSGKKKMGRCSTGMSEELKWTEAFMGMAGRGQYAH